MRYRFATFELDTEAFSLREAGRERVLQRKVFDLLQYLVQQRGRVVTKDELLDSLWGQEDVNESVVAWSVFHARQALRQRKGQRRPIETVHGRGYRFSAEVELVVEGERRRAGNASRPAAPVQSPELEPALRELLALASVAGETFELPLLAALTGLAPDALLARLGAAVPRGLLVSLAPHRYRFAAPELCATLHAELPAEQRCRAHLRAARYLESFADSTRRAGEIALHYHHGLAEAPPRQATTAARRAGEQAVEAQAFDEAAQLFVWARDAQALDPSASARERAELLLALGGAQRLAGHDNAARDSLLELLALGRSEPLAELCVRAVRVLRPSHVMSGWSDAAARAALERALEQLPPGAGALRVEALAMLACLPPYASDLSRAAALCDEADGYAQALGSAAALVQVACARLHVLSGPDSIDARLEVAQQILALDLERGRASVEAYSARVSAHLQRGELPAAEAALDALTRLGHGLRFPETWFYAERVRAQLCLARGELARAEARCDELEAQSAELELSYGPNLLATLRGLVRAERDGPAALMPPEQVAAQLASPESLPFGERAYWVRVAAELNLLPEVRARLPVLCAELDSAPRDLGYLNALCNLARAATLADVREVLAPLYARLEGYPDHNTPNALLYIEGSVSHFLGLLAARLGDSRAAAEHFERALATNTRLRLAPQCMRTALEYADLLQDERSAPARRRRKELLASARDSATALGLHWPRAPQA